MPTSTSNIPIHPGFSWRRTGQKLLAGLLAALVAGSSMLSSMPVVMAKSLGVGEVIKEVISSDRFTVADGVTYEEALFKTEDGKTVAGFMLDTNYGTEGSNLLLPLVCRTMAQSLPCSAYPIRCAMQLLTAAMYWQA